MSKNNINQSNAFTIVETLLVLAIAAIIIIIILLAVPALQRTTRNTSIKRSASAIVAAIEDFESNIEAKPSGISMSGSDVQICSCSGCTTVTGVCTNVVGATAEVPSGDNIYVIKPLNSGKIPYNITFAPPAVTEVPAATVAIDLGTPSAGYQCYSTTTQIPTADQGYAAPAGSSDQIPVYYPAETGNPQIGIMCLQA